jgi:CheY-like chemotaxis protein
MRKTLDTTPPAASRLLLVDDNRNGRLARRLVLEEQGFTVTTCSTPEDALQQFNAADFDIVVTDYRMPRMDGTELIAEMRRVRSDVRVILVSGMVDVLGLTEQNTGADAVISKSSTEVPHMIRAVNRLRQKAAPRKPVASQRNRKPPKASNG